MAVSVVPMPRSSGFSWLRCQTTVLASVTASDSPAPVGWRPNATPRASMASREATSPPAWPPIPSATANRLGDSTARSWLTDRTRPVSVAEPDRRSVISLPHFEHGAAHLQKVTLFELGALADAHGVHPGAVGGTQVLRPQVTVQPVKPVSYTHLRAHETVLDLVC